MSGCRPDGGTVCRTRIRMVLSVRSQQRRRRPGVLPFAMTRARPNRNAGVTLRPNARDLPTRWPGGNAARSMSMVAAWSSSPSLSTSGGVRVPVQDRVCDQHALGVGRMPRFALVVDDIEHRIRELDGLAVGQLGVALLILPMS